jgi:hypothetical protein
MPGLKLGFTSRTRTSRARASGVRGVTGSGATPANIYSAFLFAPEPINQNHKQLEATVEIPPRSTSSCGLLRQLPGNQAERPHGGARHQYRTSDASLSPIALAPDNSVQQFYVTGAYNFSKDTRANLKVAWSEGRQDDAFLVGQPHWPGSAAT